MLHMVLAMHIPQGVCKSNLLRSGASYPQS